MCYRCKDCFRTRHILANLFRIGIRDRATFINSGSLEYCNEACLKDQGRYRDT
jgi:hypothetical protein